MNILLIMLQAGSQAVAATSPTIAETNYLSLIFRGGWILVPLFILFFLSIYFIIERWITINILGKNDKIWMNRLSELVAEGKTDKSVDFCKEQSSAVSNVLKVGLENIQFSDSIIQEEMQTEARQQIAQLENRMNYLGIISSVAPMLGFLGTILGVIKIFYNTSVTADLNIGSISDGLYQKMISSGAGLFVGIVAYSGYYVLNGRIDKVVARIDKCSNDLLRSMRIYKKTENAD